MPDAAEAVAREIEEEIGHLDGLRIELAGAPEPWTPLTRRAVASVIHDFYTCCERVFRRIALEVDGSLPADPGWHRRLLASMASEVPGVRPAVVSRELASTLDEYLGFRHVFRNIYGFELEGERLSRLARELPATSRRVEDGLRAFVTFLRAPPR